MSSLIIRKHSAKVWEHIPSDQPTPFYLSKFYVSLDDNKIRIVEQGESKRNAYSVFNVTIEVVGGSTFSGFTSASELLEKLEELDYPAFYRDGEFFLTEDAVISALGYTPENVANKATTLGSPNDTTYPTTQTVVTEFNKKLSNLVADYTNATTPLNIDDKAIIFQGGTPKLVNVSEFSKPSSFDQDFIYSIPKIQSPAISFMNNVGNINGTKLYGNNFVENNKNTGPLIQINSGSSSSSGYQTSGDYFPTGNCFYVEFFLYGNTPNLININFGHLPWSNGGFWININSLTKQIRAFCRSSGVDTVTAFSSNSLNNSVTYCMLIHKLTNTSVRFVVRRKSNNELIFDETVTTNVPNDNNLGRYSFLNAPSATTTAPNLVSVLTFVGIGKKLPEFLKNF